MAYTTINKHTAHMDHKGYLGSSSAVTVSGLEFQPDLVWIKDRDNGNYWCTVDAVRGVGKYLQPDNSSAETNNSTNSISAFTSDGFTTGTANPANEQNSTTKGFHSWNWKANGSGSANTDGTVNSTVSVNTTAGFSIVKWTHTTSGNYTVGHGLGATPKMIIVKSLTATNWGVYHSGITAGNRLILNNGNQQGSGYWGANAWTNDTFSIGTARDSNGVEMVAYCWTPIVGYSSIGSYTGNGNATTPTFIYTGMKPKVVIVKCINEDDDWFMHDDKRDGYNDDNEYLRPSLHDAEGSGVNRLSMYSNGFNVPTTDKSHNKSGNSYIYIAWGQSIVGSNNTPTTAR